MAYDYIGAPWNQDWGENGGFGGNGGFSIRDKNKSLLVITQFGGWGGLFEDVVFSRNMMKVGGRLSPKAVSQLFAIETCPKTLPSFPDARLTPWGVHKIWSYQPNWESEMVPVCPGLEVLHGLQRVENFTKL